MRLLTDNDSYQELLIAEDELIDEYLAGQLTPADQRKFEECFLAASERQRKVRFGKALQRYVAENPFATPGRIDSVAKWWHPSNLLSFKSPFASASLVAASVLLVVGISWLVINSLRSQVPGASPPIIVTAILTPASVREGGEITKISISPETDTQRLLLALPMDQYPSYRAIVLTSQGANIVSRSQLRSEQLAEGKSITVDVPANVLSHEDYQVKVSGQLADGNFEDLATYTFRVLR